MPKNSPKSAADRAQGLLNNVHPRLDGSVIPLPDDVLEGQGDFVNVGADGNPTGLRIGHVENPDGWDVLIGDSPETTTQQNVAPLPITRPSFVADQPPVDGPPAPKQGDPLLAKIPKPETPILKKVKASNAGYPATTPSSPLWYAYAWRKNGRLSPLSPPVPFQVAQGQGARVSWGDPPTTVDGVSLFVTEPGTSTATSPGPMREQRALDFQIYKLKTYDLTGPYRYDTRLAPTSNETMLAAPPTPGVHFASGTWTIGGDYLFWVTVADEFGESLASPSYHLVQARYVSGKHLEISRPFMSASATGWYVYVQKYETQDQGGKSATGRLYMRNTNEGKDRPFSASRESIAWTGDLGEGAGAYYMAVGSGEIPKENTTGIKPPDATPGTPVAFGASRPGPGTKYARVVERVRGLPSLASDAASVDLAFDEMLRVIRVQHTNRLPNGDNLEVTPDSLPFDHVVDRTGGDARVIGEEMVLWTNSPQVGATPSDTHEPVPVSACEEWALWGKVVVENPQSGAFAGSVEVALREINATGQTTDTVVFSASQPGEYEYHQVISPSGGSGVAWRADTVQAQVVKRSAGATKHHRHKHKRVALKNHRHKWWWEPKGPGHKPSPPPGTASTVAPPPEVAPPAETYPFPKPDRPRDAGTVLERVDFENGIPAGWVRNLAGGATMDVSPSAALSGAQGLLVKDATTTQASAGWLGKVFDPGGRHDLAVSAAIRPALLPSGRIRLHGLATPDGRPFAWFESGSLPEIATLSIDGPPTDPGYFSVFPDGASGSVAVVATKQVEQLSITQSPTAYGTITLFVGGVGQNIGVGGGVEVASLTVQSPRHNGYVTVAPGGVPYNIPVRNSDSGHKAARRIREYGFPGWTTGGSGNIVTFEATSPGPRGDSYYLRGTSGTPGQMVTLEQGYSESAANLADRIAGMYFPGYTVSHVPGSTTPTFTAVQAGPKPAPSVSWGSTGAGGTISTSTPGVVDTPEQLAARIRGTAFSGWTLSGSGRQIVFTSNTPGWRRDLRFDAGGTGAPGSVLTTQQGKNADLTAHLLDDTGVIRPRQIMANLDPATAYNAEVAVSGAGTDKATVNVWGSIGVGQPKQLLGRWENVSLTNYPAGTVLIGVTAEADASETWEIHLDGTLVTDRGETCFRERNARGELVNQLHHYGLPTQPTRDDIYVQDWRFAIVPGQQYVLSAYMRYDNVRAPAKPLYLTARGPGGKVVDLGGVTDAATGAPGITGTDDWREHRLAYTTPDGCYEAWLHSRGVGAGEIVLQEVVNSPGSVPKRTYRYAASGSYRATLRAGTPGQWLPNTFWGHGRKVLLADIDAPAGTTAAVRYRAAESEEAIPLLPPGSWRTDPASLEDLPALEVEVTLTTSPDAQVVPVLKSDAPRVEYDLFLGGQPLSTFLNGDRTELLGGAIFAELSEFDEDPEVAMEVLPGMRLMPQVLSDAAPTLPESTLIVFTADARARITNNWYEPWVVETDGWILTVRLSAKPAFKRISVPVWIGGQKYGVWTAKLSWGEIIEMRLA